MKTQNRSARVPPQLSSPYTTRAIMGDVLIALAPSLCMSVFLFGLRVLALTALSVGSCVLSEYLYRRLSRKSRSIQDLSACVSGVLLAMCLPVTASYWAPVLGGVFAIVVVKQFYGGLGGNFMNPALAGRMLLCTFPRMMTTWVDAFQRVPLFGQADVLSSATPMSYLYSAQLPPLSLGQLMLGQHGGCIGEVSVFMLLLGGGYLLLRGIISPHIPLSFLGTVALCTFLTPQAGSRWEWMSAQLLCGGLIMGAFFMATDYTTSPVTAKGQLLYGVGCGLLTVLLRYYGSYPDGVGWAILTMNCGVWLLDRAGMPRRFGVPPLTATREHMGQIWQNLSAIHLVLPQRRPREGAKGTGWERLRALGAFPCVLAAAVAAVLIVHLFTEYETALRGNQEEQAILSQVMPQAQVRNGTPYYSPNAVSITAGYDEDSLVGYCVEVQTPGFGGMITLVVGVDLDGKVTGVAVTDHRETLDFGTRALERNYLDRFIGRSGTLRLSGSNSVDAVSGATVTSKAVIAGVNKALEVVANLDSSEEFSDEDGEI